MNETTYDIFDIGFNKFLSRETPLVLDTSLLDLPSPSALDSIITSGTSPVNLTSGEWVGNISIKDGYLRSANFVTGSAGWKLNYDGVFEATAGIFSGTITATSGTIGGWNITTDRLQSAASGVRVELDKANLRVSIFDATNEKVVMGYLNGLPKNDGTGNWGASNYGFWARSGDMLSIDGDGEFINGDWIIQNDASYLVNNASAQTIIRLGTDTGEKGLFIYNTAGVKLAKFISDQIYVGTATNYLQYTTATGLKLYSNIADAITLDYGSNILLKHGGDINFTSVVKPTACTATLVETDTGNINNGTHKYKVTYTNATGETELGSVSNTVTVDATHKQVDLSGIPISTSGSVTSRKIYRTKAGGNLYYYLVELTDNIFTTYTDNIADTDLGVDTTYRANNTFGKIIIDNVVCGSFGNNNVLLGPGAVSAITTGYYNIFIGGDAGGSNDTGSGNIFIGGDAGIFNTSGSNNIFLGTLAGGSNDTGNSNIFLGYEAGFYETGSNAFYINNQDRTNTAGDKTKSLLYGVMAAAAANQKLTINGLLNQSVSKTPAAANATGTAGDICWDASNIYVCIATDTWKKVAIATW